MVAAPRNQVSLRPRALSRRSVKTCPRSRCAASWISAGKVRLAIDQHRLDSTHPVARGARNALFLAGDQGNRRLTELGGDAIVDFPREQPQRQSDHAAVVLQHALHGPVRLARVGGAEQRRDGGCRHAGGRPA
jgi:hypothetical protein